MERDARCVARGVCLRIGWIHLWARVTAVLIFEGLNAQVYLGAMATASLASHDPDGPDELPALLVDSDDDSEDASDVEADERAAQTYDLWACELRSESALIAQRFSGLDTSTAQIVQSAHTSLQSCLREVWTSVELSAQALRTGASIIGSAATLVRLDTLLGAARNTWRSTLQAAQQGA